MKELSEFEGWLNRILNQKMEEEKMPFVWELMKSPFMEFHYNLLKNENIDDEFKRDLESRFNEHGEKAELFLLSKLDNNIDKDFHAEIIFILGKIKGKQKDKTLEYARKLSESESDFIRDRAIIVLGWLGTIKDTEILSNHLINDHNSKCRAWSASSFMQMWFRKKSENLLLKAFSTFQQALKSETDMFVLATILDAIREMGQTKLGVSQKDLDNLDINKIAIAKVKAERFLDKKLKME